MAALQKTWSGDLTQEIAGRIWDAIKNYDEEEKLKEASPKVRQAARELRKEDDDVPKVQSPSTAIVVKESLIPVHVKVEQLDKEVKKISNTVDVVKANKFKRCFEAEDETFRGKPTGNKILNTNCKFCSYRFDCWSNLVERPAVKSQAKQPRMVAYVHLKEEYVNE